jgi:phosphatidylglycerol:prolipoprotein diacylglycerol transferase
MLPVFSVFGNEIYSYPLILGVIWALAYNFLKAYFKIRPLPNFSLLFTLLFAFSWIGAKVLFLITLDEALVLKAQGNLGFWLGGGFVFYGGFIGGASVLIIYLKSTKIPLKRFEVMVPVLAMGHGIGRIACFLAGCCYGTFCELPWAINLHGGNRHPVQLYESISLILLSIYFYRRVVQKKSVCFEYLASYALLRFILEIFRGDRIRGIYAMGISTSQIVSLILLGVALFALFFKGKTNPKL